MGAYDFSQIEAKWQQYWKEHNSFAAEKLSSKPKYYVLDMFPYPSGAGLHVGHPLGYIATDVITRFKRMKGFNVLHPMGFDSFGLPAEQYAVETGVHPVKTTERNISRYLSQMAMIGLHHDPEAVLRTSDPGYYKWTQWIFVRLFEHWYDTAAQKARPVSELVALFETQGSRGVQAACAQREHFSADEWKAMTPAAQDDVLMRYRLAYNAWATVNWCPALGTVLANDEVKDGRSERGNHPVERRQMRQWMLRITAYADRLLEGLNQLEWSDAMKAMQSNWIGRSNGAGIRYEVQGHPGKFVEVFTTRPDTIFGNSFMVLAPEHPLVQEITTDSQREGVEQYVTWAAGRTERDRMADTRKTGAFTGAYCIHPFTGAQLPIWISDYVVISYGTGAIMAVPGHDVRDWEFAHKFGLPIREVVAGGDISKEAYVTKDGRMVNSGFLDSLTAAEAIHEVIRRLEEKGIGWGETTYRMRDVIWSRQRYWGEPTPIVFRNGVAQPVPDAELPLALPHLEDFSPTATGEPPLARAAGWRYLPDGGERELSTMPGAAGSSWYFLRYFDANNERALADPERIRYWMPVDLYVGGTEHAVGHLLYSRFWTKFLYDLGICSVEEPFRRLVNQGMIQGISEKALRTQPTDRVWGKNALGEWLAYPLPRHGTSVFVSHELAGSYPGALDEQGEAAYGEISIQVDLVKDYGLTAPSYLDAEGLQLVGEWKPELAGAAWVCEGGYYYRGEFVPFENGGGDRFYTRTEVEKMSKSKFNVVNPESVIGQYGADTFRLFEMFLGPIEQSKPWDIQAINGVYKFLRRFWSLFYDDNGNWRVTDDEAGRPAMKALHKAIRQVEGDIERLNFNTCIPAFMTLCNELKDLNSRERSVLALFVKILSPFAPHIAEELWAALGNAERVLKSDWPLWDEAWLAEDSIEYPIQINGKVRAKITVAVAASPDEVREQVLALESVQHWLEGKAPKKVIVVPGRIVNVVS